MLNLAQAVVLVGIFTPFALPPLIPILLLFYFVYIYFQVHMVCT